MFRGSRAPLVHFDFAGLRGEVCTVTTRVVTTFWVDTFSADLVALAVGLSALAEHLEEGRWLFAGDDIHVPLNWVTSIVQSVPIPPYNKFRTVRIPRYYGTLCTSPAQPRSSFRLGSRC